MTLLSDLEALLQKHKTGEVIFTEDIVRFMPLCAEFKDAGMAQIWRTRGDGAYIISNKREPVKILAWVKFTINVTTKKLETEIEWLPDE